MTPLPRFARLTPGRQRKAGQAAFMLTVVEEKRARKEAEQRLAGPDLQCFTCRAYFAPAHIARHEETGEYCCWHCAPTHERHYDRWLARKTEQLARES